MSEQSCGALACQFETIRRTFAQAAGLPFGDSVLAEQLVEVGGSEAWGEADEPVYSPLVTLGMFLSQVLDPDPSCRQAVARLNQPSPSRKRNVPVERTNREQSVRESSLRPQRNTLCEQPSIELFGELGWQTANCFAEIDHGRCPLGRGSKGEAVLVSRLNSTLQLMLRKWQPVLCQA